MLAYINFPVWLKPEIIPGLPIRWYSVMYLVAFAIAYLLFKYQLKERKLEVDDDTVSNFFFWTILGLLIGARIFSTLIYDPTGLYRSKPWLIIWPFHNGQFTGLQGMSFHGGVVGAIIGAVWYTKANKIDTLEWGDMLVAGIPLGYTFGRLGNFINGELYGRITSSPFGMIFPHAEKVPTSNPTVQKVISDLGWEIMGDKVNLPRHPSQLYEAFFEGIFLWAIIWFIFRKKHHIKGLIISLYMIGYGFFRFVIEYFRQPDKGMDFPLSFGETGDIWEMTSLLNFSTGQILSLFMIIGGIIFLIYAVIRSKKE